MTTVYLSGRFCPLEVMPVTAIDGRAVGDGRPGPIARRLLDGCRRLV
jgi:branched-subunit amino acid aminotransferase/4-amino-4-deoxychorismate lyase